MCFAPQRGALFRHLNFQKWCVLCILTWKCASRRNGVQPHGSAPAALASLLFDPPEPQIIGKNTVFRDFSNFFCAPASSFFSLFLFSDLLSSALLLSDTLPASAFPSVHAVGSVTSKLPSIKKICVYIYIHISYYRYICIYSYLHIYFYIVIYIYIFPGHDTSRDSDRFSWTFAVLASCVVS